MTVLDETVATLQALEGPYSVDDLPRHIAARIVINLSSGCWEADYAPTSQGYTLARWRNVRTLTHRLVYTLLVGPIPDGLTIDHVKARGCISKKCCNPAHLEPVTNRVNILRSSCPTAVNAAKTHCPKGHPYDEANTYYGPKGGRECIQCRRDRSRAQSEARAASEGRVARPAGRDKTHCINGHDFTPENTIRRDGEDGRRWRECRECHRTRNREYYARKSPNGLHRQPSVYLARLIANTHIPSCPSNTRGNGEQAGHKNSSEGGKPWDCSTGVAITTGSRKAASVRRGPICNAVT